MEAHGARALRRGSVVARHYNRGGGDWVDFGIFEYHHRVAVRHQAGPLYDGVLPQRTVLLLGCRIRWATRLSDAGFGRLLIVVHGRLSRVEALDALLVIQLRLLRILCGISSCLPPITVMPTVETDAFSFRYYLLSSLPSWSKHSPHMPQAPASPRSSASSRVSS